MLDFIRIACAVPAVKVGDVKKNTEDICSFIKRADEENADVVVFPELSMTGYTCGDLFYQDVLHNAVEEGVARILRCSQEHPRLTAVVGLPVRGSGKLYNCAAVISGGKLHALISKTYLPDYAGCNESRWFSQVQGEEEVILAGSAVTVSTNTLYRVGDAVLAVEICEDLYAPLSPSVFHALHGAEVVVNLAASSQQAGKRGSRRELVKAHSSKCKCIYAYVSAGFTESTTDLVLSGHSIVSESGNVLAESKNVADSDYLLVSDCDLGRIRSLRQRNSTFRRSALQFADPASRTVTASAASLRGDGMCYPMSKSPFVPEDPQARRTFCLEAFQLQVTGLKRRLESIGGANAVIGISGGLDSTLALLVAVEAMRQMGRPASDVYGVTMPCFGTSDRTYSNSWELMRALGISPKEISIRDAVTLHFADIGHDPKVHNATYENAQARERTQILMDYASVVGGIVVGTGDLSELALGWCTYNGDHMSMYGVNGDVPKTMIRWIIDSVSQEENFVHCRSVLLDVLDTPISPELQPPDAQGKIAQQTEDLVGPYALHDFFLYYLLTWGFAPGKVYTLACRAFREEFDADTIKKWLKTFYRRFFTQQFKRSCMPDGVKVCSVGLSPRGDWMMPSDAAGRIWLEEIDKL